MTSTRVTAVLTGSVSFRVDSLDKKGQSSSDTYELMFDHTTLTVDVDPTDQASVKAATKAALDQIAAALPGIEERIERIEHTAQRAGWTPGDTFPTLHQDLAEPTDQDRRMVKQVLTEARDLMEEAQDLVVTGEDGSAERYAAARAKLASSGITDKLTLHDIEEALDDLTSVDRTRQRRRMLDLVAGAGEDETVGA